MKTYTKTIEAPRLLIKYDENSQSPREWSNLGYFVTVNTSQFSPDRHPELEEIILKASAESTDQKDCMHLITKAIKKEMNEKVLAIYPIVIYEHSAISYCLGSETTFDYNNPGFYIVTDKTAAILGTSRKEFKNIIEEELKLYTQWANGEVYYYQFYREDGALLEACGGYYDLDDIKSELPEEWKGENLTEYMQ